MDQKKIVILFRKWTYLNKRQKFRNLAYLKGIYNFIFHPILMQLFL